MCAPGASCQVTHNDRPLVELLHGMSNQLLTLIGNHVKNLGYPGQNSV